MRKQSHSAQRTELLQRLSGRFIIPSVNTEVKIHGEKLCCAKSTAEPLSFTGWGLS